MVEITNVIRKRSRKNFNKLTTAIEPPKLLQIQNDSYNSFLGIMQTSNIKYEVSNLNDVFASIFPVSSYSGNAYIEYVSYKLGNPEFTEDECRSRGLSYAVSLKVKFRLIIKSKDKETVIKQQDVYITDMPLMTKYGGFIINGADRVVVSQLHRSPGVFFESDSSKSHVSGKILYVAKIIPYRGSWLDFEFDIKDNLYIRIDKKRKISLGIFLRILGYDTEEILEKFYDFTYYNLASDGSFELDLIAKRLQGEILDFNITDSKNNILVEKGTRITLKHVKLLDKANIKKLKIPNDYIINQRLAKDIVNLSTGEVIAEANNFITQEIFDEIKNSNITNISTLYINEYNRGPYISNTLLKDGINNQTEALFEFYHNIRPGEPPTEEIAKNLLNNLFFVPERYNLSVVGRMKLNLRLNKKNDTDSSILTHDDIFKVIKYLISIKDGEGHTDDIDHLGNRRVRSIGEMIANQLRIALLKVQKSIKERLLMADLLEAQPQHVISTGAIVSSIKEFFCSSQLSQFMDQVNPLAEVTHKRRISALGPGGLNRDRAGFEVRDVHPTHYGRCVLLKLQKEQMLV